MKHSWYYKVSKKHITSECFQSVRYTLYIYSDSIPKSLKHSVLNQNALYFILQNPGFITPQLYVPFSNRVWAVLFIFYRIHYKEYLVNLINKNKVDPVHIMNITEMTRLIERDEKTPPQRKPTYQDSQYRKKLIQVSKEQCTAHVIRCSTLF
jgi:hypothetical protein